MAFSSSRLIPSREIDLDAVAQLLTLHFEGQGYQVVNSEGVTGPLVSLKKGNMFQMVLGMQTALNVELKHVEGGISATASVGVLGRQTIPTLISLFILWPVLLTQIWGLIKQSKLDDEVLDFVEKSIEHMNSVASTQILAASKPDVVFCTACGKKTDVGAVFCPYCGTRM